MALIDNVKQSLRITSTAYDAEIADLILAAKADLGLAGVLNNTLDTDALIKRAIILYCKAQFGWNNPDAARLQQSYESLRNHISQSADYAFYSVTFTVKDALDVAIRQALVTFDGEEKETNASGVAIFYCRAGSNYSYTVEADYYVSDDDESNLVDVSAATTVGITLTEV
jgi:hypothetical protein